jgi:hypothetical protein
MKIKTSLCAIAVGLAAFAASASDELTTYTLPDSIIATGAFGTLPYELTVSEVWTDTITTHEFMHDGINWTLSVTWISKTSDDRPRCKLLTNNGKYSIRYVKEMTLSTEDLAYHNVENVDVITELLSTAKKDNVQLNDAFYNVSVSCGNYNESQDEDVNDTTTVRTYSFSPDELVNNQFAIKFAVNNPTVSAASFSVPNISITYDPEQSTDIATATSPEAELSEQIYLLPANSLQKIYYAIDDDEDWTPYTVGNGIDLTDMEPGTIIRYYATESKCYDSPVTALTIADLSRLKPLTISDAIDRYEPITLSGYITGQTASYTLIADTPDGDDAIAVDNSNFSALKEYAAGTAVTVTGRTSDTFGRASLTSISDVVITVQGATTHLTSLNAADALANQTSYDIAGRRATASTPGIRISRGIKSIR